MVPGKIEDRVYRAKDHALIRMPISPIAQLGGYPPDLIHHLRAASLLDLRCILL
jgi:hypothetical protein